MKTALVYDRINKWGGAERVLLTLHELFPDAPLFTTVYDKEHAKWASVFDVKTSFLQQVPLAKSNHEFFPWVATIAFEQFTFDEFDLVISVTSAEAKGIITKPGTTHICYCLTPTRYLWSHYDEYFKSSPFRVLTKPVVSHLKKWDKVASSRPDHYIAISTAVQERIQKYYARDAHIIFPPVEIKKPKADCALPIKDYFLIVSRLVPYKKIDLAIDVFNKSGYPLVIVGQGRDEERLKNMAAKNIFFVKDLTDEMLSCYYKNSLGFLMLQEEDFGLSAVEAQLHGVPVIAYKKGGAIDSIVDGKTGILFNNQTTESVKNAIIEFGRKKFKKEDIIKNAERFNKQRFKKELLSFITKTTR